MEAIMYYVKVVNDMITAGLGTHDVHQYRSCVCASKIKKRYIINNDLWFLCNGCIEFNRKQKRKKWKQAKK